MILWHVAQYEQGLAISILFVYYAALDKSLTSQNFSLCVYRVE